MISYTTLSVCVKTLVFSCQKCDFKIVLMSYDKQNLLNTSAPVLLNSLNSVQKSDSMTYSKTCLKRPLKKKKTKNRISTWVIAKYRSKVLQNAPRGSILQNFQPAFSYHLSLRPLFCLFLSGCLRQVLLYTVCHCIFTIYTPLIFVVNK